MALRLDRAKIEEEIDELEAHIVQVRRAGKRKVQRERLPSRELGHGAETARRMEGNERKKERKRGGVGESGISEGHSCKVDAETWLFGEPDGLGRGARVGEMGSEREKSGGNEFGKAGRRMMTSV